MIFFQKKMNKHRINLRKPNGQVKKVSPLEGAQEWAKMYFPKLCQSNQVFRSVSYKLTTHFLVFNDREWDDFVKKKSSEDQKLLNNLKKHIKGTGCELKMHDFFVDALKETLQCSVMLNNFHHENFCGLFNDYQCHRCRYTILLH